MGKEGSSQRDVLASGLLASLSDPVVTFDRTGRVQWYNDAFAAATEDPEENVSGRHLSDLFAETADVEAALTETTENGEATFVTRFDSSPTEDARVFEFKPTQYDDGAFAAIGRDVTDRHARAVAADRYETVFNSLPDAVYAIESDGTFRYVNDRYVEMKGVDRDALLGTDVDDWVTEETVQQADELRELLSRGEQRVATVEYDFVTVGGERFPAELRFTPVDEDASLGRVGTIRDVTERAEREAELRRQNERLDEFASIVTHDLRTPLSVAEGRLELARREHDSEQLDAVQTAHSRIRAFIDDILTLAREGNAEHSPTPTALESLVEDCWHAVTRPSAALDVRADATVVADERQLRRLLENLFRNAVEHGGDDVTITVGLLDDGFYVEDDGPGIDDGSKEKVFDTSYSTSEEGTGLGLRIVAEIVNRHGWVIDVTDATTGSGARFEITGVTFD